MSQEAYQAWLKEHMSLAREMRTFLAPILSDPRTFFEIPDGVECYDVWGRTGVFDTSFRGIPPEYVEVYPRRQFLEAGTGHPLREVGFGFEPVIFYMTRTWREVTHALPTQQMVRPVGQLGDGRILYLFSDGTVRTADGALLK